MVFTLIVMRTLSSRSHATGRITLSDVAQRAGVSPITVSRALRGERAVDPDLIARVKDATHKLGYLPDSAARARWLRATARMWRC